MSNGLIIKKVLSPDFKPILVEEWENDKLINLDFDYSYSNSSVKRFSTLDMGLFFVPKYHEMKQEELFANIIGNQKTPADLPFVLSFFVKQKKWFYEMLKQTDYLLLIIGTVIKNNDGVYCYPVINGAIPWTNKIVINAVPVDCSFDARFSILIV